MSGFVLREIEAILSKVTQTNLIWDPIRVTKKLLGFMWGPVGSTSTHIHGIQPQITWASFTYILDRGKKILYVYYWWIFLLEPWLFSKQWSNEELGNNLRLEKVRTAYPYVLMMVSKTAHIELCLDLEGKFSSTLDQGQFLCKRPVSWCDSYLSCKSSQDFSILLASDKRSSTCSGHTRYYRVLPTNHYLYTTTKY